MRAFRLQVLPLAPFLLLVANAAAAAVPSQARLVVPKGNETVLKSELSLPVKALPAPPHQPVAKGTLLVDVDVSKLEKELDGARKSLSRAQAEKRRLATERGATSSTPSGQSRDQLSAAQAVSNAQLAEASALSDLSRLQTQISSASLHAPADGYVVQQLYAVGAKIKRRTPLLIFAEAGKTRVEASVPAADAAAFTSGAPVRIASAADPAKAFRGQVESAAPGGDAADSVALSIRPLELPFLALDTATAVTLTAER
jgi:multidrug resistance efflux pump